MKQPKYKLFQQLRDLVQTVYDMIIKNNYNTVFCYSTDYVTFNYKRDLYIIISMCAPYAGSKFIANTETEQYETHKSFSVDQFIHHLIDENIEYVLVEDLIFKLQTHLIAII